jgi:hypothetical protein
MQWEFHKQFMRILIILFTVALAQFIADAEPAMWSYKDSKASDGLIARIYYPPPNASNLLSSDKILVGFLSSTNGSETIYFPKDQYLCRMQLVNSKGVSIPKTRLGERYGAAFYKLTNYSWEAVNKKGYNTGGGEKPDTGTADKTTGSVREFPGCTEMFRIKTNGDYVLTVQLQIFELVGNGLNHTFKIVHLQPLDVHIIHGTP